MDDIVVKSPSTTNPAGPPTDPAPIQDVAKSAKASPVAKPPIVDANEVKGQEAEAKELNQPSPAPNKPKSRVPKLAIGLASFVCLSLIGLVVYLAMNGGLGQDQAKTTTMPEQTTGAQNQAELQNLGQEANTLPEPGADPSTDLTDQALGL